VQTGATTLVTLYAKNSESPDRYKQKFMLSFIVEPATVLIASSDSFSNAKVSGSRAYVEQTFLNSQNEPYRKQLDSLFKLHSEREADADKHGMELFQNSIDSIIKERNENVYYKYMQSKPSSIITNFTLFQYTSKLKNPSDEDVKKVADKYGRLSKNERESYYGRAVKKKIDAYKISVGMIAPEIVQTDVQGNPFSLSSFKGKYVLLDFWASWCAPCRRDFPNVKELYREYNNHGFEVVGISKDVDTAAYLKAIRQDGLTIWSNLLINEKITKSYFVSTIPLKIFINPEGVMIGIWREGGTDNFNLMEKMIMDKIKK